MSLMTAYAETGITTGKFVRRRQSDGMFWSTATPGWEAFSAGNIANYGTTGSEITSTGVYTATDPDPGASAGDYLFVKAAGASLAVADLTTGIRWQENIYANPVDLSASVAAIKAKTDLLNPGMVTMVSPVQPLANTLVVYQGSAYTLPDRAVVIAIPVSVHDLTGIPSVSLTWAGGSLTSTEIANAGLPAQSVTFEADAGVTGGWNAYDGTFWMWANANPTTGRKLDVTGRLRVVATIQP